jgi:transketolase C-terminal domain/subunit
MEGDNAEAARYAVARNLKVKLLIDDNDVTIAGHPTQYMKGFDVEKTLVGHGLVANTGDGEALDSLFSRIQQALAADGPVALINKRPMAVGIPGIEGTPKGHDVVPVPFAVEYLKAKGHDAAVAFLEGFTVSKEKPAFLGSTVEMGKVRDDFGKVICEILDGLDAPEDKVLVVDSDLEGSCGLHHIRKNHPEVYVSGGIMERNNYSVAAGFGSEPGRVGIYGTFSAFQEMVISEITMARLNEANVIAHFSHAGIDDMADNTCRFGINNFFADNALAEGDKTRLYFPADILQLKAILKRIFDDEGLRFVYSTRSATPCLLDSAGELFYGGDYVFEPGKDEFIREGRDGCVVTYGEMTYRCLDAVEQLRQEGHDIGLINKPTLNVIDEEMLGVTGKSPFVLIVESQNTKTGLGSRYGSWLLERGYAPKYASMGTARIGHGGIAEQLPHQGLAIDDIKRRILSMIKG